MQIYTLKSGREESTVETRWGTGGLKEESERPMAEEWVSAKAKEEMGGKDREKRRGREAGKEQDR